MSEIMNVNYDANFPTVSARELHNGLSIKTNFTTWFIRMSEYGFQENTDYYCIWSDSKNGNAVEFVKSSQYMSSKGYEIDYYISIDMAKQICMIQRSDKGLLYRKYFLKIEESWNSPEAIMARALQMADKKLKSLEVENDFLRIAIKEQKPKVEFHDAISVSEDCINFGNFAATFQNSNHVSFGRNKILEWCRHKDYLCSSDHLKNKPSQQMISGGYMQYKENVQDRKGKKHIMYTPLLSGKGQIWLTKKLLEYFE